MSKKSPSLSFRLKLVLIWSYVYFIASILLSIAYCSIPDSELNTDPNTDRILTIFTNLIVSALAGLTIYLLHKRKEKAVVVFIMMTLVSYGLSGIGGIAVSSQAYTISEITIVSIFFLVDLYLVAYLLLSAEVKSQLKQK